MNKENKKQTEKITYSDIELQLYGHVIQKQEEKNKLCKQSRSTVCNLHHTKFIRDADGSLKEICYLCDKQKRTQSSSKIKYHDLENDFCNKIIYQPSDCALKLNYFGQETCKKLMSIMIKQNNEGFYLYGDFATGKTFLIQNLIRLIMNSNVPEISNQTISYAMMPNLFTKITKYWQESNYEKLDEIMNLLKNETDILFIDDIGSESTNSHVLLTYILDIFNHRYLNRKTTIFISKYDIYELEKMYEYKKTPTSVTEKLIDRISRLSNYNKNNFQLIQECFEAQENKK